MRTTRSLVALCLFLLGATSRAEVPIPPAPTRWVTDTAGFMSPAARQSLDATLERYQRETGHQLLVWIGRTTGATPVEDWTVRAFQAWRVGRKGIDDGLVVFVFADDRKIRIEVGYGLEGVIPDAVASRIIREVIAPRIRAGDHDGAITAGVAALMQRIGNPTPDDRFQRDRGSVRQPRPLGIGQIIFLAILGLAVLIFLITHPTLAAFLLFNILSGGRGGGGGSSGGGFSGGGGRSGGGGATGSW
jgi:uncharacterized protein